MSTTSLEPLPELLDRPERWALTHALLDDGPQVLEGIQVGQFGRPGEGGHVVRLQPPRGGSCASGRCPAAG